MVLSDDNFNTAFFFERDILGVFWACFFDQYFSTSISIKVLIDNDFNGILGSISLKYDFDEHSFSPVFRMRFIDGVVGKTFVRYFSEECLDVVDGVLSNFSEQKVLDE